jgi:hypothetical protein
MDLSPFGPGRLGIRDFVDFMDPPASPRARWLTLGDTQKEQAMFHRNVEDLTSEVLH